MVDDETWVYFHTLENNIRAQCSPSHLLLPLVFKHASPHATSCAKAQEEKCMKKSHSGNKPLVSFSTIQKIKLFKHFFCDCKKAIMAHPVICNMKIRESY